MSIRITPYSVVMNDALELEHDVLYCGAGPHIVLRDLEEDQEVSLWTKQEVEQVKKMCEEFLKHIDTWDWVKKDKEELNK